MQVTMLKENDDGSANFLFDLTPSEAEELLKFGILEALKAAIREGEKLTVNGEDLNAG